MERKHQKIGKKVWVMEEKNYSWKPNKEKTWTIKDYIDWGDERLKGDYCPHLVLEDAEGNTKDIREWEVVVIPDTTLPVLDMVNKYISDNELYIDDISGNDEAIAISIEWGDWKHSHGYLDELMKHLDYTCGDQIVTEENGSDCYSATHYFYKVSA